MMKQKSTILAAFALLLLAVPAHSQFKKKASSENTKTLKKPAKEEPAKKQFKTSRKPRRTEPVKKNVRQSKKPLAKASAPTISVVKWRKLKKGLMELYVKASCKDGIRDIVLTVDFQKRVFRANGKKTAEWTTLVNFPKKKKEFDFCVTANSVRGASSNTRPKVLTQRKMKSRWRTLVEAKITQEPASSPDESSDEPTNGPDLQLSACYIHCLTQTGEDCGQDRPVSGTYDLYCDITNEGNENANFPAGACNWNRGPGTGGSSYGNGIVIPPGEKLPGRASLHVKPASEGSTTEVTFYVDPDNAVAETNESNNSHTITLTTSGTWVPPQPDLAIQSVTITPPSGGTSSSFDISVVVENKSAGKLPESAGLSCPPVGSKIVHTIYGGQTKTYDFSLGGGGYRPPGTNTITCTVDSGNRHAETNENNNTKSATYTITED